MTRIVAGYVKWFDPARGFGFVISDDVPHDILLHANVLRNFGQSSIADGAGVRLRVLSTSRGTQATELVAIDIPEGLPPRIDDEVLDIDALGALEIEPARVKWFDRGKGFGFANVFGRPEDVFLHMEILRASGLAEIAPGEAVCLRIMDGKRGRMAVQLMSWESAARRTE
nr:cold shock protein [Falsirhodobacter halotolerans]